MTLLKAGVFEALLVRLAVLFRSSEKMYCLNGQILRRSDAVDNSQNGRFLFECMFEFGERVNALGLTDEDIALFSAVVLVSPGRFAIPTFSSKESASAHKQLRLFNSTIFIYLSQLISPDYLEGRNCVSFPILKRSKAEQKQDLKLSLAGRRGLSQ